MSSRGSRGLRSKVAVRGGEFKLPISADNREGAGVAAGDEIEVTLELDTERREIAITKAVERVREGRSNR